MKKLILIFLIVLAISLAGCGQEKTSENLQNNIQKNANGRVICNDPPCLGQYFPTCTPTELIMKSEGQNIEIIIYGFENDKCHYSMKMNGITAADCFFKKEDLNNKILNQMFGNKEGQDAIIAEACKTA